MRRKHRRPGYHICMRLLYRIGADGIFLLHCAVVLVALFGWYFPGIWYFYITALVSTLISALVYGYCVLSKWEFNLRRKLNPENNYDYTWATYYTRKISNHRIPNSVIKYSALTFIFVSLGIQFVLYV